MTYNVVLVSGIQLSDYTHTYTYMHSFSGSLLQCIERTSRCSIAGLADYLIHRSVYMLIPDVLLIKNFKHHY